MVLKCQIQLPTTHPFLETRGARHKLYGPEIYRESSPHWATLLYENPELRQSPIPLVLGLWNKDG